MEKSQLDGYLKIYEPKIRSSAHWYCKLWPRDRHYDVNDLMQAGRTTVFKIAEKRPEMLDTKPYVNAAIRYGMFRVIKQSVPKRKEIHLIQGDGEETHIVDLLPAYDEHEKRLENVDEIYSYIRENFTKEDADSLKQIVDQSEDIYSINLSNHPSTHLKDKMKFTMSMDLSDEEIVTYAEVLTGALERFPRDYVVGQRERARKYIRSLLDHLSISPEEFASLERKIETLKKYKLDSFYQKVYGSDMTKLFGDVFPDISPFMIREAHKKWQGREGLINASDAIDWLARKTGKIPEELEQKDFKNFNLRGLVDSLFNKSYRKAVEFRYPGTYPELAEGVSKLWDGMK